MINLLDLEYSLVNIKQQVTTALGSYDASIQSEIDALIATLRGADDDTLEIISDEIAAAITSIQGADSDTLKTINDKQDLIQPTANSIDTLYDEVHAMLDLAEQENGTLTCDGTEQFIYTETNATVFMFGGCKLDFTGETFNTAESVTIRVYEKIDGTNYRVKYAETLTAVPSPVLVSVPRSGTTENISQPFYNNGDGVRVSVEQTVEGDGYFTLPYSIIDAKGGN